MDQGHTTWATSSVAVLQTPEQMQVGIRCTETVEIPPVGSDIRDQRLTLLPLYLTQRIPHEVFDAIIDCFRQDRSTLVACSLVSHAWLPRSRYFLTCVFNRNAPITLESPKDAEAFTALVSPPCSTMARYLYNLSLRGQGEGCGGLLKKLDFVNPAFELHSLSLTSSSRAPMSIEDASMWLQIPPHRNFATTLTELVLCKATCTSVEVLMDLIGSLSALQHLGLISIDITRAPHAQHGSTGSTAPPSDWSCQKPCISAVASSKPPSLSSLCFTKCGTAILDALSERDMISGVTHLFLKARYCPIRTYLLESLSTVYRGASKSLREVCLSYLDGPVDLSQNTKLEYLSIQHLGNIWGNPWDPQVFLQLMNTIASPHIHTITLSLMDYSFSPFSAFETEYCGPMAEALSHPLLVASLRCVNVVVSVESMGLFGKAMAMKMKVSIKKWLRDFHERGILYFGEPDDMVKSDGGFIARSQVWANS